MGEVLDVAVIGAGSTGLSISYLKREAREHKVLDGGRIGDVAGAAMGLVSTELADYPLRIASTPMVKMRGRKIMGADGRSVKTLVGWRATAVTTIPIPRPAGRARFL